MKEQPKLKLQSAPNPINPAREMYAVVGFEALDRWASVNNPLWAAVRRDCERRGIDDAVDLDLRLMLTCAVLLEQNEKLRTTVTGYATKFGPLSINISPPNGQNHDPKTPN